MDTPTPESYLLVQAKVTALRARFKDVVIEQLLPGGTEWPTGASITTFMLEDDSALQQAYDDA